MLAISRLTRQLKLTHLCRSTQLTSPSVPIIAAATTTATSPLFYQQSLNFATGRKKVLEAKNAKRLKIQAKKKKNLNRPAASKTIEDYEDPASVDSNEPFLQHQEWVKFQQSITVDGFQTGQTTIASTIKKNKGGKQARKRRERDMERLQEASMSASDLKYPAIRYSEEETEELLRQAYAARPERAGKRGSRNLKRQARRWKLVRQIRAKYKRQLIAAHERRMEKRRWKRQKVKNMKEVEAPAARIDDAKYQQQVLTRWAETMFGVSQADDDSGQLKLSDGAEVGGKTISTKE